MMLSFGSPFQSGMVLQQNMGIPVWGYAEPNARVILTFAGQAMGVLANGDGEWHGTFSPVAGSFREYEMELRCGAEKVVLEHVLVGEVWVCAGQSNMQYTLKECPLFAAAKAESPFVEIREMRTTFSQAHTPQKSCQYKWVNCKDEKTLGGVTAEGWFFGREIAERLHVPVGLLNISRGGTVVEAWTPKFMYDAEPELFAHQLDRIEQCGTVKFAVGREEYQACTEKMRHIDVSNEGFGKGWAGLDTPEPEAWRPFPVPNFNSVLFGDMNGAYWYRKDVEIPQSWQGKELSLNLGIVDDLDTTYFNGQQVGFTDRNTPEPYNVKRVYPVPASWVKTGRNVIAVRNFDEQQVGGLCGPELKLECPELNESIDLSGDWLVRAERILHQIEYPVETFNYYEPSSQFNAIVAPLAGYAARGVIWHQGENNTWNGEEYGKYFNRMVRGWRKAWGRDDLPFIAAHLAGYTGRASVPAESSWAWVREGIRQTAHALEGVYSIPLVGLYAIHDQHFTDKLTVGKRMSDAAFAAVYRMMKPEEAFAPDIQRATIVSPSMVKLEFEYGDGLFFRNGDADEQIAVAGEDGVFHWADQITAKGDALFVHCAKVPAPVTIRYAWANNPKAMLCNGLNVMATPFQATVE